MRGGLGNQLFIYAMARALSVCSGMPLRLDVISGYKRDAFNRRFLLDNFNISGSIANKWESYDFVCGRLVRKLLCGTNSLLPITKRRFFYENRNSFIPEFSSSRHGHVYLMGYWQSYLYFERIRPQLKAELTLKSPLGKENLILEKEILSSESVSIHVRQDNLSNKLNEDYYFRAVEIIKKKVVNPRYFIFSDSPGLSEKLSKVLSARLVNINGTNDTCYKDLWLMSLCRHHIVANSTFSWWGAWLTGENPEACIIAPETMKMFNSDILPPNWIALA